MSEWQIAQAFTSTRTSPGPGFLSFTSSIWRGAPNWRQTAAFTMAEAIFRGLDCGRGNIVPLRTRRRDKDDTLWRKSEPKTGNQYRLADL
jgi:hypothetical protein